jgi:hypothetical protein
MQQTARLGFERKVIAFMHRDEPSNSLGHLAGRVITPQLMRRAVRQHGFRIHTAVQQLAVDRRFARRPTEPPDDLLRNERARLQEQTCLSPISTN